MDSLQCSVCGGPVRKFGKDKYGQQRFHCNPCNKTFIMDKKPMRLERSKALLCLKLLVEGNSVRSTERITGVHRDTVLHLLKVIGTRCEQVMEEYIKDIPLARIEADEIWRFVQKKEGHKTEEEKHNTKLGDAYTFVGIEATSKLVVCFLLGREEELELLRQRWEQAKAGHGQIVLLSGEPGISKSRLVQVLQERVTHDGATHLTFRCSPYGRQSAFDPIITHLHHLLHFEREETPQSKLGKLSTTLAGYRFPQAATLPLLAALLSLPHPDGAPPVHLSPQRQKQKTHEALVAWLVEEAERQPVYCAWEDLHEADPSTLEVLSLVVEQVPTARLYLVLTFRPEFRPPWGLRSYMSHLTLSRLGRLHAEALATQVTRGKPLPGAVLQQIVTKTDGVPLFVEELTKMVVESGLVREAGGQYVGAQDGGSLPLAIPGTLHDSLMARLDRLPTAKAIAQLGATIGREFGYELLQAVAALDEGSLEAGLRQLVQAELVYQHGLPPHATYLFKHALIQGVAYQSLLKSTRQRYHQHIAQVLEERFAETKATQPELLAHHYTEAGLGGQALPYWQRAGELATQRSANVEAISHLTKALELLKRLPDTPERTQQELDVQITLGPALIATKGWAAPDTQRVYTRARALCGQIGETPQRFAVLRGLWAVYHMRAELQTARELAEQLLTLAHRGQNPDSILTAHTAMGFTLLLLGEFASAHEHFEHGLTLYDSQAHHAQAGRDQEVFCRSVAAWSLWALGYPDQAMQRSHEALSLARELALPFVLASALSDAALLHLLRKEGPAAQERAEQSLALSTEHEFAYLVAQGTSLRGQALARQGHLEEGLALMRQGWTTWGQATGTEIARSYVLGALAEVDGEVGWAEDGLSLLAEGLTHVHRTGEQYYEAELYRLKGTLLLQSKVQGPRSKVEKEAEGCFLKAIEIARRQSAKSWELRAVMSLSRLWQKQDKKAEARQLLAEIYHWFTEGFDTKDLQEAKVLLEELA